MITSRWKHVGVTLVFLGVESLSTPSRLLAPPLSLSLSRTWPRARAHVVRAGTARTQGCSRGTLSWACSLWRWASSCGCAQNPVRPPRKRAWTPAFGGRRAGWQGLGARGEKEGGTWEGTPFVDLHKRVVKAREGKKQHTLFFCVARPSPPWPRRRPASPRGGRGTHPLPPWQCRTGPLKSHRGCPRIGRPRRLSCTTASSRQRSTWPGSRRLGLPRSGEGP